MKIAIAGTRGIPNNYGGFEQCAEYLSVLLAKKGHEVIVYNPHDHPYAEDKFNGVHIVKCFNPEKSIGTAGNFIYDYLCMKHAVKVKADILLMLGYTTASIFFPVINFRKTKLITNMDGLEWKRDKWNSVVKKLALWFESLGARYSPHLVADNEHIQTYLQHTYGKDSACIAYGCLPFENPDESVLSNYQVTKGNYGMVIARMEAENNIDMTLAGFSASNATAKLLVTGNLTTAYGKSMFEKYSGDKRIVFTGGIYNQNHLNNLRFFSKYYFHGHTVGGTNPSLLEAMASGAFIFSHDNGFNKSVLGANACYYKDAATLTQLLNDDVPAPAFRAGAVDGNMRKVKEVYSWPLIASQYEQLFERVLNK